MRLEDSDDARIRDTQKAIMLGAAGGASNKNRLKIMVANKLKALKRFGHMDRLDIEWFEKRFDDPKASIQYMALMIEDLRRQNKMNDAMYLDLCERIHKLHHGTKHNIDISGNVQINFGASMNKFEVKSKVIDVD